MYNDSMVEPLENAERYAELIIEVKRVLRPYSDRLLKTQRREMKAIDVVYNIHQYINYAVSVLGGFLQSQKKRKVSKKAIKGRRIIENIIGSSHEN